MKNAALLDEMYGAVRNWGNQGGLQLHFVGPMFAREVLLKAGEVACMHVHDYDHVSLYVGHVRVVKEGEHFELKGAGALTIKAGERHGVVAVTDTVWICAHDGDLVDPANLMREAVPA